MSSLTIAGSTMKVEDLNNELPVLDDTASNATQDVGSPCTSGVVSSPLKSARQSARLRYFLPLQWIDYRKTKYKSLNEKVMLGY